MSAAPSRYLVSAFDYGLFQVVVEASSERDAINKAHFIYAFNGRDEFTCIDSDVRWEARLLVPEVAR
ncbi:hypothetical protein [Pseudolabrys sp.]|uniref:hypothetical protein n=1 Tax=Pseudolabrys sp. TaxID=1960880 RepID=UPI003D12F5FB